MSEYILNWQSKGIEGIHGKSTIALAEEVSDSSSSSLVLTGKLLQNYGRIQQENFMRLLENFASANPPSNPTIGQIWFKANSNSLYILSSSALLSAEPEYRPVGENVSWLRVPLDINGSVKIGSGGNSSIARLNLNGGTDSNTGAYVAIQKAGTNIGYFGDTGVLEANLTSDLGLWAAGSKALRFYTNDEERVRIHANGNVGIGTNAPALRLHVVANGEQVKIQGAGNSDAIVNMQPSGNAVYNWIRLYSADGLANASVASHSGTTLYFTSGPNGDLQYRASGNGTHIWYCNQTEGVGPTERMRLDNSGNLGIGTTTPTARLEVAGKVSTDQVPDIQITRSSSGTGVQTGPNITLKDGTTANSIALQATQGRFGIWNYGGGSWNERLAINASGAFGLNGTNYGTSGQVLTSNGSGAPPTWTTVAAGSSGSVTSVSGSGGSTGLTLSGGPITSSGTLTLGGTLAIGSGGTGQTTANASFNALAPSQAGNSGKFLTTDGTNTSWATVAAGGGGSGTVTSIAISGGSTGLTTSGGPITSSGTITLGGTLAVAAGGTGQTTASAAINALVPSQTGNSGKYLTTDGSVVSWATGPGAGSEISSITVFGSDQSPYSGLDQWAGNTRVRLDQYSDNYVYAAIIGASDRYCVFTGASTNTYGTRRYVVLPSASENTGRVITLKADFAELWSYYTYTPAGYQGPTPIIASASNLGIWQGNMPEYITGESPTWINVTNEIVTVSYNWVTIISNGTHWIPIMRGS